MIDLEFVIGIEKQVVRSSKIAMTYTGQMSVSYSLSVTMWNASKDFIAFIASGRRVSIYTLTQGATRDFLFDGIVVQCKGNTSSFSFIMDDYGFYIIKNNMFNTVISAELSAFVSSNLRRYGMVISKKYTNNIFVTDRISGLIRDYLDAICRTTKLVWNIRGNNLFLGNGLTDTITSLDSSSTSLESNSLVYKNKIVNLFVTTTGFQPALRVGDVMRIGFKSYPIVKVIHSYKIDDEMEINARVTSLTLASEISDVFAYVNYNHDMKRIFEVNDVNVPSIKFDTTINATLFYNPNISKWLGELEHFTITSTNILKNTFFNYDAVTMSLSVGIHIPYNILIISIVYRMDTADDVSFELYRNGELTYTFNTNYVRSSYVDVNKEINQGGELSLKRGNTGLLNCANCIIEIKYRRIV